MNADELLELAEKERAAQAEFQHRIIVCAGTGCQSLHSERLLETLETEIKQQKLEKRCSITGGGCRGLCAEGPLVSVEPQHLLYQGVKPEDAAELVASLDNTPIERLRCDVDMPFFTRQKKVVLEHNGMLDPERIEAYIAKGGFA